MLSVIGSTGTLDGFSNGPRTLYLTGQTYHCILPSGVPQHPIHWMLYGETDRPTYNVNKYHVPSGIVTMFRDLLVEENLLYVGLEIYCQRVDQHDKVLELWIENRPNGNKTAALISTANGLRTDPRAFYVWN
ncbi:hypothetical protein V5O48_003890 [Marasmius crinis-equi]|uniref:Uncharacterized protein n=1 Tax=Marasmius crinis-equi TaxID=585013 RepID=A0ABR3FRP3_9AGAR